MNDANASCLIINGEATGKYSGGKVASSQTQLQNLRDSNTQTSSCESKAIQADTITYQSVHYKLGIEDNDYVPEGLVQFLRHVCGTMEENLSDGQENVAYQNFFRAQNEERTSNYLYNSLQLNNKRSSIISNILMEVDCTGLSWNSTGSILAATFGNTNSVNSGALLSWNIFNRSLLSRKVRNESSDIAIDHSCGLLCLSFHPEIPSLVATGSSNGEVMLWDFNLEESLACVSPIEEFTHQGPVQQVAWVYGTGTDMYKNSKNEYRILSLSSEGRLLIWSLRNQLMHPIQGYTLAVPKSSIQNRYVTLGSTHFSILSDGKMSLSLIIGSEGGSLVKCNLPTASDNYSAVESVMKSSINLKIWESDALEMLCAVHITNPSGSKAFYQHVERFAKKQNRDRISLSTIFESKMKKTVMFPIPSMIFYEPHEGPIRGLVCAPFHRTGFGSCGIDGTLKIFSTVNAKSALIIEPSTFGCVCALDWSFVRPLVIAVLCEDSNDVQIFDLGVSVYESVAQLKLEGDTESINAASKKLAFNPKLKDYIAVAGPRGSVNIWQLESDFTNATQGEREALERLCNIY